MCRSFNALFIVGVVCILASAEFFMCVMCKRKFCVAQFRLTLITVLRMRPEPLESSSPPAILSVSPMGLARPRESNLFAFVYDESGCSKFPFFVRIPELG